MFFQWDDGNEEHLAKHGVDPDDAEYVVRRAKRPYPRRISDVKWLVHGRTRGGRLLQVIYVVRDAEDVDVQTLTADEIYGLEEGEAAVYIIHARPLRAGER